MALREGRSLVEVVVAATKDELLKAASGSAFDCVVLDFNLTPYTAPELIPDLREVLPDTPILVVSSSEDQRVVVESLRHGVADFVHKDSAIHSDGLWDRIETAVNAARQRLHDRRIQARRLRHLHREASTDPLTGLSNRRQAERYIESDRTSHDRRQHTAIVMMDLDRFKEINDTHGHHSGDLVLKAAADVIRQSAQRTDLLARWGGEEFLLVRSSPCATEAWNWADDIRRTVSQLSIPIEGGSVRVTASFGVAVLPTAAVREHGIVEADKALYLAKDLGRNRVCTVPMVHAVELSEWTQSMPHTDAHARLSALRDAMIPGLRPTQREQIVDHGIQVRNLALQLGRIMQHDVNSLTALLLASEFHDLGKVAVPEELLAAERRLTDSERRFVNEHARFGADLIRAAGVDDRIARLVERHHDRYDHRDRPGSTRALLGTDTELVMILTVADSVVAMTSDRPYAVRRSVLQALSEVYSERGAQFDPTVVDALHRLHHAAACAA